MDQKFMLIHDGEDWVVVTIRHLEEIFRSRDKTKACAVNNDLNDIALDLPPLI